MEKPRVLKQHWTFIIIIIRYTTGVGGGGGGGGGEAVDSIAKQEYEMTKFCVVLKNVNYDGNFFVFPVPTYLA